MEKRGIGIVCPYCGGQSKVYNCRQRGDDFWRRRKCLECGKLFSTWEFYVPNAKKHRQRVRRIGGKQ